MSMLLNLVNVLGFILLILGILFMIYLVLSLIFSKKNSKNHLNSFIIYISLIVAGALIIYIVSINTISLKNTNIINSSVQNPKAITMNLHQNAEVTYKYDRKYVSMRMENGMPSFNIKATADQTVKIVTTQKYKNSFWVNTIDKTVTIIKYND